MAKRVLALVLGILLLTGFVPHIAAAATTPAKKAAVGGELNLPASQEPDSLNPIFTVNAGHISNLLFAGLFEFNEKLEPTGNLAESWKASADALTWTIQIRKGVQFHDGSELTADDVVFTYQSMLDAAYNGPRKATVATAVKAVSAPDKYTVKVELKLAVPGVYNLLSTGIISKKQFSGVAVKDLATAPASWKPVGAGPYKFVEYKKGSHVLLERNPNWFKSKELGGAPFISKVRFKVLTDPTKAYQTFVAGDLDVLQIERRDVTDKIKTLATPFQWERNGFGYYAINTAKTPFDDKRVRQALTYGVDRRYINKRVFGGDAAVPASPIHPLSWAFDSSLKPLAYDATRAMELLEEAGYKMNADGFYEKNGRPLKVTISFSNTSTTAAEVVAFTGLFWILIGIEVEARPMEFNAMTAAMDKGDFDIAFAGFSLAIDPDLTPLFHSGQTKGYNRMRYKNTEVDKLLESGARETDLKKRKETYAQVQRKIMEDAPVILMYAQRYSDWVSKKVKGGVVTIPGAGVSKFELWWINEQ